MGFSKHPEGARAMSIDKVSAALPKEGKCKVSGKLATVNNKEIELDTAFRGLNLDFNYEIISNYLYLF